MRGSFFPVSVPVALLSLSVGAVALADGRVTGQARFERVKGRPARGYVELYESNLFLSPDGGTSRGPSFRLGAPPGEPPRGDGYYSLDVPAGTWSILVNQPLFFIRPRVIPGVVVRDGRTTVQNVDLPIDYSTFYTDTWTGWDSVWIQTFVATGASITGVSWKLAGTTATEIRASVHADNGNPSPATWPQVSSRAAKTDGVGALTDNWVRWRSGEVPTVPGRAYAIKLTGVAGGDRKYAVFNRQKDASSYASGRAYNAGGAPQNFDLNITVFSDNDSTAILYNKTTEGLGDLRDGNFGGRWGQTFKATRGTSLAAADVWAAGADRNWDLDFTFRVYRGGPGGPAVGPSKTTRAAFQAFGAGLHGVSYNRGEVPLTPGQTYYVEFTNPEGFNPYVMGSSADNYPDGAAYQDRRLRQDTDLSMTIIVYSETGGTVVGRVRDASSGAGVGGATVSVVELGQSASSESDGSYEIPGVPRGTYTVRAAKAGYTASSRGGVQVETGETTTVDLSLSLEPCGLELRNPSFEQGLFGWTRYGDARDRTVPPDGGEWFGGITARDGNWFHGNEINGCCLNGGLYQQICAVPGHRYRVTVWSNVYWIEGGPDDATNRLGIDLDGNVDPEGPVVWSPRHRQTRSATEQWRQLVVEARATGPVLTVFLDFRQVSASGNQWRINCFDLLEVEDRDGEPRFVRGDCQPSGSRDITDSLFLLVHLFQGGADPSCDDACDSNDDGAVDISDATFLLNYLFLGGEPPAPPGGANNHSLSCGPDPTPDGLDCAEAQTWCAL